MSQYSGFNHLEGASGYNLELDDDLGSVHSSATTQHNHNHSHQNVTQAGSSDAVEGLNFDSLTLDSLQQSGQQVVDPNSLYDEDFDGMLDDLTRELPPHACR